jgi:hypothetical protein
MSEHTTSARPTDGPTIDTSNGDPVVTSNDAGKTAVTTPAATGRTSRPPRSLPVVLRVVAALTAAASVVGMIVSWFVGLIVFTGCFIKCDLEQADPVAGIGLFLLAGLLLVVAAVGVKLAATGRSAGSMRVATVSGALALVAVVATAAAG